MEKYKYKHLPMGIKITPGVFQIVVSKLVQDMEYSKTYLHDLLILTNRSFKDHLLKLEMVLARLSTSGMRVNHKQMQSVSKYTKLWSVNDILRSFELENIHENLEEHLSKQRLDLA
jgi:hypothetical protein